MRERILSLCDYTGTWGGQYEDKYEVIYVDLQRDGSDVRLFRHTDNVHGVIAQPPCDHFAVSGARWWKQKGEAALLDGLQLVDACLRIVIAHNPNGGSLKIPLGGSVTISENQQEHSILVTMAIRIRNEHVSGESSPCRQKNPVEPTEGSKMHLVAPGPNRKNIRSATPQGFAKAFRMANP